LWTLGVFDHADVGAMFAGVAEFSNGGGAILQQTLLEGGIGPCSRHHARALARADFMLVSIDERIE
jgi:hypothetical protein